jgi:hypothetical protein
MKQKDDDIAHSGRVSKPEKTPLIWLNSVIRHGLAMLRWTNLNMLAHYTPRF